MLELFIISVFFGFFILFECWRKYLNHTKLKNFVVISGLPVLGCILDLIMCDTVKISKLPKLILAKYKVKTDFGFVWMGPLLLLCTTQPEAIECILNSDKALKKSYLYNFIPNTNGLLTIPIPAVWKVHR